MQADSKQGYGMLVQVRSDTSCCSRYADCRPLCRNVRRDSMKTLDQQEKAGDLSEDEKEALEKSVQEITDDCVKQIDELVKAKQTELTTV